MAAVRPALLENLARLARGPENAPFREWLEEERQKARDALEALRDAHSIAVAQGRAQAYRDLQELLAGPAGRA